MNTTAMRMQALPDFYQHDLEAEFVGRPFRRVELLAPLQTGETPGVIVARDDKPAGVVIWRSGPGAFYWDYAPPEGLEDPNDANFAPDAWTAIREALAALQSC